MNTVGALEAVSIRKEYPGVVALRDVSIRFERGRVHALIGKNGAGKSTLIKIIGGSTQPSEGRLLLDGQPVRFESPRAAIDKGIATVHQELSLVPELSVAENILMGRLPRRNALMVDWPAVWRGAEEILGRLGTRIDVHGAAGRLSVARQQMVEIAKAMAGEPRVLMLDEPTSALTREEAGRLFEVIRGLTARGVAIIYISHRLQELCEIADEISVLRDGELVGALPGREATPGAIASLMFGQVVHHRRPADLPVHQQEAALEVRELRRAPRVNGVSFVLHKGEILGIAGMLGAGRTELVRMLLGADAPESGEIVIGGRRIRHPAPPLMKALGVGMTPEDRKEQALVLGMSIGHNLSMAAPGRIARRGVIRPALERELVADSIRSLAIKAEDPRAPVGALSGGNQQKVVVGNWLNTRPRIMLFDEPTRGIDVQAKEQIFEIIWRLSREGISSIFISSELEELLDVCHRILVMQDGRITAETGTGGLTIEGLFKLCSGEKAA